jgi:hypothetical protein
MASARANSNIPETSLIARVKPRPLLMLLKAGIANTIKSDIIPITTISSIRVKPRSK